MNREDDPFAEAFARLRRAPLDDAFAARVQARARAELVPARRAATSGGMRLALASVVPALLLSAALYHALETVELAATIYARRDVGPRG